MMATEPCLPTNPSVGPRPRQAEEGCSGESVGGGEQSRGPRIITSGELPEFPMIFEITPHADLLHPNVAQVQGWAPVGI